MIFMAGVCHAFGSVHCCFNCVCVCVTFPCGILGQVWYLIILIPGLCRLSYFYLHFLYSERPIYPMEFYFYF